MFLNSSSTIVLEILHEQIKDYFQFSITVLELLLHKELHLSGKANVIIFPMLSFLQVEARLGYRTIGLCVSCCRLIEGINDP